MKATEEMVWPVENYTDKIHQGIKFTFWNAPHLSFTREQLKASLVRGFTWLANPNERQSELLNKLVTTGVKKLIQKGIVKKVTSTVSVEPQWILSKTVEESGYTNITSDDSVAATEAAKKATERRAVGGRALWRLNHQQIAA